MPRRRSQPPKPEPIVWTDNRITIGIQQLRLRISELDSLASDKVHYEDPRKKNVEDNIETTIKHIFGLDSDEQREFSRVEIYHGDNNIGYWYDDDSFENQQNFEAGIPYIKSQLINLIQRLEEKRIYLDSAAKTSKITAKSCPKCNRDYSGDMFFCTGDGTPLNSKGFDSDADTLKFSNS